MVAFRATPIAKIASSIMQPLFHFGQACRAKRLYIFHPIFYPILKKRVNNICNLPLGCVAGRLIKAAVKIRDGEFIF